MMSSCVIRPALHILQKGWDLRLYTINNNNYTFNSWVKAIATIIQTHCGHSCRPHGWLQSEGLFALCGLPLISYHYEVIIKD